jgi:hypothetical protein
MIVQYKYNPVQLFQGISVVLLLVFLYFVGNYIEKYVGRQDEKDRQIDIFTGTVFPSVTYIKIDN